MYFRFYSILTTLKKTIEAQKCRQFGVKYFLFGVTFFWFGEENNIWCKVFMICCKT